MSKRFLVQYTGPITDFVTSVNAEKVIFHPIKSNGGIDKVGEVYDQNAFNFVLKDAHITPYVPNPQALKQLNDLQKAREKAIEEAAKAERVRRLENQIAAVNAKIDAKQAQVVEAVNLAKVVEEEIKDLFDLIPKIKDTISDILGVKKKPEEPKKKGKK